MTATKHTPGPWWPNFGHICVFAGPEDDTSLIAHLMPPSTRGDFVRPRPEVRAANARLIAAAPELLEALESLIGDADAVLRTYDQTGECECVEFVDYVPAPGQEKPHCRHTRALAAIAKARGR